MLAAAGVLWTLLLNAWLCRAARGLPGQDAAAADAVLRSGSSSCMLSLVPRGELKGDPRVLLKGLERPGWLRGDVAAQYLKASSLGWLDEGWGPEGPPGPEAAPCEPGPQVELNTLSALT